LTKIDATSSEQFQKQQIKREVERLEVGLVQLTYYQTIYLVCRWTGMAWRKKHVWNFRDSCNLLKIVRHIAVWDEL